MIRIPAGVHTLDRQVIITRPRLVLRGDGSAATVLKIDKPLKAIPGVPRPGGGYGYYNQGGQGMAAVSQGCWLARLCRVLAGPAAAANAGGDEAPAGSRRLSACPTRAPPCSNAEAFINLRGKYLQGPPLTAVVGQAERGAKLITVGGGRDGLCQGRQGAGSSALPRALALTW